MRVCARARARQALGKLLQNPDRMVGLREYPPGRESCRAGTAVRCRRVSANARPFPRIKEK